MNQEIRNNPLVSVVITTAGRLSLLQRAVESVRNQNYKNIELIVVDDASEDGTEMWCQSQDFMYVRINKEEKKNGNYARNKGLSTARGKYIAYLDDDDAFMSNKISEQVKEAEKGYKVVYTLRKFEFIKSSGFEYVDEPMNENLIGDISSKIFTVEFVTSTSTILFEKNFLNDIGGWDEKQTAWQDNELLIRCAQKTKFQCINGPLTLYRVDKFDKKKMSNKFYNWRKAANYMIKKHKPIIKKLSVKTQYQFLTVYVRSCVLKSMMSHLYHLTIWYFLILLIINPGFIVKKVKSNLYKRLKVM